ncbi:TPA_asm: maturation protein, partial [ssRNA phage SRR7976325_15]
SDYVGGQSPGIRVNRNLSMVTKTRFILGDSITRLSWKSASWQCPITSRGITLGHQDEEYFPNGHPGHYISNGVTVYLDGQPKFYDLAGGFWDGHPNDLYVRTVRYLESFDSVSSVGWNEKKPVLVAFKSSSARRRSLVAPVRPLWRPPYRKPLHPPTKREVKLREPELPPTGVTEKYLRTLDRYVALFIKLDAQFEASYRRRLRVYQRNVAKREAALKRYIAVYDRRLAKYKRRLAQYEALMGKNSAGKRKSYRVVAPRMSPLPQNPYNRLRVWFPADTPLSYNRLRWSNYMTTDFGNDPSLRLFDGTMKVDSVDVVPSDSNALAFTRLPGSGSHIEHAFSSELIRLDALVKSKLVDKVNNQKVNLVFMAAERAQTFSLIADVTRRLLLVLRGKRKIMHAIGKYAKKSPRRIADDYLAFQFGVLPLMSDLKALTDKLFGSSVNDRLTFRSNSTIRVQGDYPLNGRMVTVEGTVAVSIVLNYELGSAGSRALSEYDFINPAEVAWEAMPWSFVVDWFAPVGNWLSSFSAETGLTRVASTRTVRIFLKVKNASDSNHLSPPQVTDFLSGIYRRLGASGVNGDVSYVNYVVDGAVVEWKSRSVLPQDFSLTFNPLLAAKSPISWTHGFESLALLAQRLLKP